MPWLSASSLSMILLSPCLIYYTICNFSSLSLLVSGLAFSCNPLLLVLLLSLEFLQIGLSPCRDFLPVLHFCSTFCFKFSLWFLLFTYSLVLLSRSILLSLIWISMLQSLFLIHSLQVIPWGSFHSGLVILNPICPDFTTSSSPPDLR